MMPLEVKIAYAQLHKLLGTSRFSSRSVSFDIATSCMAHDTVEEVVEILIHHNVIRRVYEEIDKFWVTEVFYVVLPIPDEVLSDLEVFITSL